MVKFCIQFHQPDDIDIFESGYNAFLALVEKMPDVIRRQVVQVMGGPLGTSHLYRVLEVYFQDLPTLQAALQSEPGQRAGAALEAFRQHDYAFDMFFAEVYEEAGGFTPTPQPNSSPTEKDDDDTSGTQGPHSR